MGGGTPLPSLGGGTPGATNKTKFRRWGRNPLAPLLIENSHDFFDKEVKLITLSYR